MWKIHPSAQVDGKAELADDVEVGAFTIVHGNVTIGPRTRIGAFCEIGMPTGLSDGSALTIGADSLIRSHSIFYEASSFGPRLVTGHRVTVREHTRAGLNLQIGTLSDIQGDCTIGNYVRFHSNVHIGKRSEVGHFVWIYPYVVLTNDPTPPSDTLVGCAIHDYAIVATMSVVLPGVSVGSHALVAAHACVSKDVPEYSIAAGVPAKIIGRTSDVKLRNSDVAAYPWTQHFHRGYPNVVVAEWKRGNHNINVFE